MQQMPTLLLLVCCCLLLFHAPVAGQHHTASPKVHPDARFRTASFLSDDLPPRNTGLITALAIKLRDLSRGQPKLQIVPEMVTVGKMLEYGVQFSLRRFALEKGSIFMSRMHKKENNKWSNASSCQGHSAWHCLFGRPPPRPIPRIAQQNKDRQLRFTRGDLLRALEVMEWKTEEDQLIFAGAIAATLAPDIYHLPDAVEKVINVKSETDVNISLHGRFSDSCDYRMSRPRKYGMPLWDDRGRPCFTFDTYMRQLAIICARYRTRNVLVATDSQEFLDYLLANKNYNYVYIKTDRTSYNPSTTGKAVWIQDRNDVTAEMVDASLSDLWLLQYGHVLLGGLAGHYSRALYYLMAGRLGYAPRYRSLDGEAPIWFFWRGADFVQAALQGPDPWQPQWQWPS